MTNLQKPDLSKDTTGPFVTRDGDAAEYVGKVIGGNHVFRVPLSDYLQATDADGTREGLGVDIFLAPKEPKTVFVNWYASSGEAFAFDEQERANRDATSLP